MAAQTFTPGQKIMVRNGPNYWTPGEFVGLFRDTGIWRREWHEDPKGHFVGYRGNKPRDYVSYVGNRRDLVLPLEEWEATIGKEIAEKEEQDRIATEQRKAVVATLIDQIVSAAQSAEDPHLAVSEIIADHSEVQPPRGYLVGCSRLHLAALDVIKERYESKNPTKKVS